MRAASMGDFDLYVHSLNIARFRHLRDIELGPFTAPLKQSEVIAIAGPNGGGKSSILELVGYALSARWGYAWSLARTFGDFSFEVGFGLTAEELRLLDSAENGLSESLTRRLLDDRVIYVGYNYPNGRYAQDEHVYNELFNSVSRVLRQNLQRSLGFFLRADRSYPARGFQRESIFNFSYTKQRSWAHQHAFNLSDTQYADMYDFLVQQRYHYLRDLGSYHSKIAQARPAPPAPPVDPLIAYDELLQRLFKGYRFSALDEEFPTNLFVELPTGETVPFQDLSGGEKEVFFILAFFLRHDVSQAMILIDEPELHLHPELARKLVQQMLQIRPGNQVWLATHNPEVIDEAGRDRTIYVARQAQKGAASARRGIDEGAAESHLRDLFGYSGYIGVAPRLVFLEGEQSSADRKLLTSLFPDLAGELKFIPVGGVSNMHRVNAAVMGILEAELGYIKFYLIRDRDYLTTEMSNAYKGRAAGKIRVLERYHIENYLLDNDALSHVLGETFDKPMSPLAIAASLEACAKAMSAQVLSNMIAYRLNLGASPQDYSQTSFMKDQSLVDATGALLTDKVAAVRSRYETAGAVVVARVNDENSAQRVASLTNDCAEQVRASLADGTWRNLFPGRQLLHSFAGRHGIKDAIVLQNTLIKALGAGTGTVPSELRDIINTIVHDREL